MADKTFVHGDRVRVRGAFVGARPLTGTVLDEDFAGTSPDTVWVQLDPGLTVLVMGKEEDHAEFYVSTLEAL